MLCIDPHVVRTVFVSIPASIHLPGLSSRCFMVFHCFTHKNVPPAHFYLRSRLSALRLTNVLFLSKGLFWDAIPARLEIPLAGAGSLSDLRSFDMLRLSALRLTNVLFLFKGLFLGRDPGTIVNATAFILTLFGPSFRRPLAQLATERASSPVRTTPAICHLYQKADEPAF